MKAGLAFLAGVITGLILAVSGVAPCGDNGLSLDAAGRFVRDVGTSGVVAEQEPCWRVRRPVSMRTLQATSDAARRDEAGSAVAVMPSAAESVALSLVDNASALSVSTVAEANASAVTNLADHDVTNASAIPAIVPVPTVVPVKLSSSAPKSQAVPLRDKSPSVVRGTPEGLYAQALAAFNARRYAESRNLLTRFMEQHGGHALMPNAIYWTGENCYAQGQYDEAGKAFNRVLDLYPRHHKSADALLKLACTAEQQGRIEQARVYLRRLQAAYPDSEAARLGLRVMNRLQGRLDATGRVAARG